MGVGGYIQWQSWDRARPGGLYREELPNGAITQCVELPLEAGRPRRDSLRSFSLSMDDYFPVVISLYIMLSSGLECPNCPLSISL